MRVNRSVSYKRFWEYFILFLCGFIVFSPISSFLSQNILNLPLSLPELFFIPFYPKFRKLFDLKINIKDFAIGFAVIVFLISIAFLIGEFPPFSILSTARGYLYLVLVFSIFKNKEIRDINYIFFIALGSSVGWMLLGLSSMNKLVSGVTSDTNSMAIYGNMISLSLIITISIVFKKKILSLITFVITVIISITAGIRRQILVAFLSYLLGFISQINLRAKRLMVLFFSTSIFVISLIQVYPIVEEFILNTSPTLYVRLFVKSEQLLSGDISESDQTRVDTFKSFIKDIDNNIFPRGFVSKRTMQDAGTGKYMDSPYLELFHTFGILFAIPLILIFFQRIFFHLKNYFKYKITESAVCFIMSGVFLVLMVIEGSFLNFVYTTPFTGFVLSRIMSTKKLIRQSYK
jgi:hypothetical protein